MITGFINLKIEEKLKLWKSNELLKKYNIALEYASTNFGQIRQ